MREGHLTPDFDDVGLDFSVDEPGAEPGTQVLPALGCKSETERASHYFRARIADQFDAVIHIDTTSALMPLERWSRDNADLPETYPPGV